MMDFRGFSQPNDGFCQQHLDILATSSWISSQNGGFEQLEWWNGDDSRVFAIKM